MKRTAKHLRETAFHEAGHAVAAILLRNPFKEVSIEPNEAEGHVGHLAYPLQQEGFEFKDSFDRFLERHIIIAWAGPIAQRKARQGKRDKMDWRGAGGDTSNIIDLALRTAGGGEEASAYAKWMFYRARGLILNPGHWPLVEALAAALLERRRLSARQARKVVRDAEQAIGSFMQFPKPTGQC